MLCLRIHVCLSCLLLLRVVSGLIHPGWIRGVWTCPTVCELSVWIRFGKGCGERPCRSTWWVVSLQPSSGTEFCVCDPWFSYYHALGPEIWPRSTSYSPLSSVLDKSYKGHLNIHIWSLNLNLGFKPTSFNLVLGALAQNTFILPCHSMHHIVHCIYRVSSVFAGVVPPR